jgi:hypothetical protein
MSSESTMLSTRTSHPATITAYLATKILGRNPEAGYYDPEKDVFISLRISQEELLAYGATIPPGSPPARIQKGTRNILLHPSIALTLDPSSTHSEPDYSGALSVHPRPEAPTVPPSFCDILTKPLSPGRRVSLAGILQEILGNPRYPTPKRFCVLLEGAGDTPLDTSLLTTALGQDVKGSVKTVLGDPLLKDTRTEEPDARTYVHHTPMRCEDLKSHEDILRPGEVDLYVMEHASPMWLDAKRPGMTLGDCAYPKAFQDVAFNLLAPNGMVLMTTYFKRQIADMKDIIENTYDKRGIPLYEIVFCGPNPHTEWAPKDCTGRSAAQNGWVLVARKNPAASSEASDTHPTHP